MAGIFESQLTQGSSLSGESFVSQKPVMDAGQIISRVADTAMHIDQKLAFNRGVSKIGEIESEGLAALSANRQDEEELDQLRSVDPQQGKVYDSAVKKIKQIENAINSRGVNPATLMSRRDAEIAKLSARAPLFARRIKNLSGDKTLEFETEMGQLIKETNNFRNGMVERSLNPDIPSHVREYEELLAAERAASYHKNRTVIDSAEAARDMAPQIDNLLSGITGVLGTGINVRMSDLASMSLEQRQAAVINLQELSGEGAQAIVHNALSSRGFDVRFIDKETIDKYTSIVQSKAKAYISSMDGKIPKEMAEWEVSYAKNSVLLNVKKNNPGTFEFMALDPYLKESVAGTAVKEAGASDIGRYLKQVGLGNMSQPTLETMDAEGYKDPVSTQNLYAEGLDKAIRSWEDVESIDPSIFQGFMKETVATINRITTNPDGYTPKMFDVHISRLNDKKYMDFLEGADQVIADEFTNGVKNSIVSYARQKMAKDINNQMNKRQGPFSTKDLVTPTIDPSTGSLLFSPTVDAQASEEFRLAAENRAMQMNALYKPRMDLIKTTAKNYGGADSAKQQGQFMRLLFSDTFNEMHNPIRLNPKDLNKIRRTALAASVGVELTDDVSTNELSVMLDEQMNQEAYNKRYQTLVREAQGFTPTIESRNNVFEDIATIIMEEGKKTDATQIASN